MLGKMKSGAGGILNMNLIQDALPGFFNYRGTVQKFTKDYAAAWAVKPGKPRYGSIGLQDDLFGFE